MSIDPVCGMKVNESTARKKNLVFTLKGKTYYFCSAHCKEKFSKKGMDFNKYIPVILVVTLLFFSVTSFLYGFMPEFMGVFFIAVAILKMLDWKGFANSFSMYDTLAKRSRIYAFAYPAIEFILGILFLFKIFIMQAAIATILIMVIGTIGVAQNLMSKNPVKCACLGTLISIPLTKFTLFEDILMAIMGIMVLLF